MGLEPRSLATFTYVHALLCLLGFGESWWWVLAYPLLIFFLMIRRPPRSTPPYSSAASDVYRDRRGGAAATRRHRLNVEVFLVDILDDLSLIHISEPTRLRRISYAVFCLKKKK